MYCLSARTRGHERPSFQGLSSSPSMRTSLPSSTNSFWPQPPWQPGPADQATVRKTCVSLMAALSGSARDADAGRLTSRRVGEERDIGARGQLGGKLVRQPNLQTARLAVLDAGRQAIALADAARLAQVAVLREERQIVDADAPVHLVFVFPHHEADGSYRVIVLLLTRDLAGVAPRAVVVIDEDCVPGHGGSSPAAIFLNVHSVVLYWAPPNPDLLHCGPGMILLIW